MSGRRTSRRRNPEPREIDMEPNSTAEPVIDSGLPDETIASTLADSGEHIAQFFSFAHLPSRLANVSRPFARMAAEVVLCIPRNPERTVALRKLLEAKDAAVRALIAK
jgi:hypothetical protein